MPISRTSRKPADLLVKSALRQATTLLKTKVIKRHYSQNSPIKDVKNLSLPLPSFLKPTVMQNTAYFEKLGLSTQEVSQAAHELKQAMTSKNLWFTPPNKPHMVFAAIPSMLHETEAQSDQAKLNFEKYLAQKYNPAYAIDICKHSFALKNLLKEPQFSVLKHLTNQTMQLQAENSKQAGNFPFFVLYFRHEHVPATLPAHVDDGYLQATRIVLHPTPYTLLHMHNSFGTIVKSFDDRQVVTLCGQTPHSVTANFKGYFSPRFTLLVSQMNKPQTGQG